MGKGGQSIAGVEGGGGEGRDRKGFHLKGRARRGESARSKEKQGRGVGPGGVQDGMVVGLKSKIGGSETYKGDKGALGGKDKDSPGGIKTGVPEMG